MLGFKQWRLTISTFLYGILVCELFSHMAGSDIRETIGAFLGWGQHYQNLTITTMAYSGFKVMTVASKSFIHFCWLQYCTFCEEALSYELHTQTETHTLIKYDRSRWKFSQPPLYKAGCSYPWCCSVIREENGSTCLQLWHMTSPSKETCHCLMHMNIRGTTVR